MQYLLPAFLQVFFMIPAGPAVPIQISSSHSGHLTVLVVEASYLISSNFSSFYHHQLFFDNDNVNPFFSYL